MNRRNNDELMLDKIVLAANLYYKNNLSQQEIAKRLDVSRPWVSKLLSKAQDMGIVKITIDSPIEGDRDLEQRIKEKYKISHAGIISSQDRKRDYVALAAANYFISEVESDDVIGIGWGNAVSRFVEELMPLNFPNIEVVPLAGSFGVTFETLPNYSAIQLANKLQGKALALHAPAFCSSQEEYDTLMKSETVHSVISKGEHSDIIIAGIGTFGASFLTRNHVLSDEELQRLKDENAIGDIVLQFLDSKGNPIRSDITDHLIKTDIFKARQHARCVIAIAQGVEKIEIIHTALSLGLVDAFFTDEETAQSLLEIE